MGQAGSDRERYLITCCFSLLWPYFLLGCWLTFLWWESTSMDGPFPSSTKTSMSHDGDYDLFPHVLSIKSLLLSTGNCPMVKTKPSLFRLGRDRTNDLLTVSRFRGHLMYVKSQSATGPLRFEQVRKGIPPAQPSLGVRQSISGDNGRSLSRITAFFAETMWPHIRCGSVGKNRVSKNYVEWFKCYMIQFRIRRKHRQTFFLQPQPKRSRFQQNNKKHNVHIARTHSPGHTSEYPLF